MGKKTVSEEMKDRAVALYDRIGNTAKVGKALGISQRSVQRALADRGINTPAGKRAVPKQEPHPQTEMDLPPAVFPAFRTVEVTEEQYAALQFCVAHDLTADSLEVIARRPEMNLANIIDVLAKLTPEQVGLVMHNVALTRINNQLKQNQQAAQEHAESVLGKE